MNRPMRRKDRQASQEEALQLLAKGEYGILATADQNNAPYAVPLSYACSDNCIYFHCANVGHKLDNIASNPRVSFCVVGHTQVLPDKFSTAFESVVAFGRAAVITERDEKVKALRLLVEKYSPGFMAEGEEYINRAFDATCTVKIEIEYLTGKKRDE